MNQYRITPLEPFGSVPLESIGILRKLHVTSFENLILYSRIPGVRQTLLEGSGLTAVDLDGMVSQAARHLGSRAESIVPATEQMISRFRFGVRATDRMLKRRFEARVNPLSIQTSVPIPSAVSHISLLQPVRNQGSRGTCVAFGTVAAAEFEYRSSERFSEQFVFWAAKIRDDAPDQDGTTVECGFQALKDAGVCHDRSWSYNPDFNPLSIHQGPPPPDVRIEARNHCIPAFIDMSLSDLNGLKAVLSGSPQRQPALITGGFAVYDSWFLNRLVHESGEIFMPIPGESVRGYHCMTIVGYSDHPDAVRYPGGGYLVVRNSWGPEWAAQSEDGPGYGRIPYTYIMGGHMPEAYAIKSTTNQSITRTPSPNIDRPARAPESDRLSKVRQKLDDRLKDRFDLK